MQDELEALKERVGKLEATNANCYRKHLETDYTI